jgi:hypothetical protein
MLLKVALRYLVLPYPMWLNRVDIPELLGGGIDLGFVGRTPKPEVLPLYGEVVDGASLVG